VDRTRIFWQVVPVQQPDDMILITVLSVVGGCVFVLLIGTQIYTSVQLDPTHSIPDFVE